MIGRDRTAGALAGALTATLATVAPAPAVPTADPASHPPSAASQSVVAKNKVRGVLRVKVTGTGSYTLRAKDYRKTSTTTKTFRVRPGKYTVKAPGATVKPKKTIRVRKGKTATVRIRFPKQVAPTDSTPTPTPTSGPVSQLVQAGSAATVSTAGGYAIHIPAGVLRQSAMVSVTPLDPAPGGLPGAAFHIAGAWSGSVQVTLPIPNTSDAPVVLHDSSDGLRITSGDGAQRGATGGVPTVTASANSLSTFYSAAIDCGGLSEVARGLLCADQTDRALADWLTAAGAQAASAVQADQVSAAEVSSDCPNGNLAMPSSGDLAKGLTCSESLSGAWGEWGFTNTTHASYLGGLYSAGAVYNMGVSGSFERSAERPDDIPLLLWPLYEPLKDWYVFPKQKTKIRKTTGSGRSTITTDPDPGVTPLWASTGFLTGLVGGELIDDLVADPNTNLVAKISACMPQGSTSLSSSIVNCAKTVLIESLTYYAKNAPLAKKARAAGALAKILSAGDVLMIGASFWLALEAKIGGGLENHLTLEKIEPDLGIDPPPHPKTTNTYIARDPDTGRSVLVDRGRVTTIGTGTLFNCLARTRAVWDIANLRALKQTADGAQLSCYDEGPEWTYTPTVQGGNTGTNIILRNTIGNAWLVNSAGEVQTIEDGGTYLCLAATNPVIWNTPEDKITDWTPVGVPQAACGAEPPDDSPGAIQRISTDANGAQADSASYVSRHSGTQAWSPDSTKIAFYSAASNLVTGDTNDTWNGFIKTLSSGAIQRATTDSDAPVWSPDGTKIAFTSNASDLVAHDTNDSDDVFVKTLSSGAVQRVSTDATGAQAYTNSHSPVWSPDGTKIAFTSGAWNLVPNDTNGRNDVFVKTLAGEAIQRITTDATGAQVDGDSAFPIWSPDGTKMAFFSRASNLVPNDTNDSHDLFVKTLSTGAVQRVSTDTTGSQANGSTPPVSAATWSPDSTKIAFASTASNLVPADTNGIEDVFVKTLAGGAIQRISTDSSGGQVDGGYFDGSFMPAWSPDGNSIAFASSASNLVPGEPLNELDIFVKTLSTGAVQRVSTDAAGVPANSDSQMPVWSPDGTKIAFDSMASNLVPADTNDSYDVFIENLP